jgi:hypothetical protein
MGDLSGLSVDKETLQRHPHRLQMRHLKLSKHTIPHDLSMQSASLNQSHGKNHVWIQIQAS